MAVRPLPQSGITNQTVNYTAPSFDVSEQIRYNQQQKNQYLRELRQEQMRSEETVSNLLAQVKPMEMWRDADGKLQELQGKLIEDSREEAARIMEEKSGLLNAMDISKVKQKVNSVRAMQSIIKGVEEQAKEAIELSEDQEIFDVRKSKAQISAQFQKFADGFYLSPDNPPEPNFTPIVKEKSTLQEVNDLSKLFGAMETKDYEVSVTTVGKDKKERKTTKNISVPIRYIKDKDKPLNPNAPFSNIDEETLEKDLSNRFKSDPTILESGVSAANIALQNPDDIPQEIKDDYERFSNKEFSSEMTPQEKENLAQAIYVNEHKRSALIGLSQEDMISPSDEGGTGGADSDTPLFSDDSGVGKTMLSFSEAEAGNEVPHVTLNRRRKGEFTVKDIQLGEGTESMKNYLGNITTTVPATVVGAEKINGEYFARMSVSPSGDENEALLIGDVSSGIEADIKAGLDKVTGKDFKLEQGADRNVLKLNKGAVVLVPLDKVSTAKFKQGEIASIKARLDEIQKEEYGESINPVNREKTESKTEDYVQDDVKVTENI